MKPQLHPYIFLIFFATLFDYNLHRFITVITNKESLNTDKHSWVKRNLYLFYGVVAISVIGFLYTVFVADKKVLVALAPIAMLTLFYSIPVFKTNTNIFRLREIPFLKIFLISFVWAASTVFLPIIQSGINYDKENIIAILLERFLFVFAITIPFDIRDMEVDAKMNLKTIPAVVGKKRAMIISNILLVLFLMICLVHYKSASLIWLNAAFVLSAISTFYFINSKKIQAIHFYHYGILDGTLLLQGILVLIAYYLH